jgi:hypothetical protein
MSVFTILWILWGVFFLVVELIALKRAPGGTLSETIWRWAAVKGYRWPHLVHLRRVVLALFMVELTIHFASGRWWV